MNFCSAHDFIDVLDFFLRFLDKSLLVTTAAISILLSFNFSKVGTPKDVFPKKLFSYYFFTSKRLDTEDLTSFILDPVSLSIMIYLLSLP